MEENEMKRHIFLFTLLLTAGSATLAQTNYLSQIKIEKQRTEKTDDRKLSVKMNFNLDELDIKRQHSLTLIPVITSADGSREQELTPLVVNGRVRNKVMKRKVALVYRENVNNITTIQRRNGASQQVAYETYIPFKRWMANGNLNIKGVVTGCAECDEGNETAYMGGIMPVREPVFVSPFIAPKEETVKHRSETRTARLQFRQDSYNIDPNFKENRSELNEVRNSIQLVKGNNDLTITGIYVTGYASPEGRFSYNMKLSELRAKALAQYMKGDLRGIDPNLYHTDWKGEDWEGVRAEVVKHPKLMKQQEVLDIIDHCGDDKDACEEQLKALVPPEIYQRLLNEMYGPVRRNEYRVEYNVRHFDLEEGKRMVKTRPDLMSVSEINRVAESYGKGSREYTECLLTAAQTYPQNVTAVNNAALALLENGRAEEAVTLLIKAPQKPELLNMLGTAYYKTGQTDEALKAFERAAAMGYEPAAENERILKEYEFLMNE